MGAGRGIDLKRTAFLLLLAAGLPLLAACSPIYVLRAGWAEARILSARRPIPDLLLDAGTDEDTRGKLAYVWEARRFAADSLGLSVGDAYTTFTRLERDTLALVLSAAPRDRLEPRTWWFPVVGRMPYRAYFDEDGARTEQRTLEREGFDTYLRPTAAFSTLGWFSDPLLSTVLRAETVGVVQTVLHELAHTHLFVPGRVRFNESFATFVGSVGAIEFFCGRRGSGPRSVKCLRARGAWADEQRFSRFLDSLVGELQDVYRDPELDRAEKVERRERIFRAARVRFREHVQPELQVRTFRAFRDLPLNNATLLARMRYYHRLEDFQALLESAGSDLERVIDDLAAAARDVDDPFELLPDAGGPRAARPLYP